MTDVPTNSPINPSEPHRTPASGTTVVVFHSRRAARCRERGLVLRAMGIKYMVGRNGPSWGLLVPADQAEAAIRELAAYERENQNWPPLQRSLPVRHRYGIDVVVLSVLLLVLAALASWRGAFGFDWFGAGRIDSDLIRQGEWWRCFTALTLHVDVGHLIGNLVLGSLLLLIASRLLGSGLACIGIAMAGAIGNAVSASLQPSGHLAVGASTAVFAGLGLIGAFNWRHRDEQGMRWAVRWSPLVVAGLLLSMTGSGGPRTDVMAHMMGFVAGLLLGVYLGGFKPAISIGRKFQAALGLATVVTFGATWWLAIAVF